MANLNYDSQSTIYNAPALGVWKPPSGAGVTIPANADPDQGNTTDIVVPLHLTSYQSPSRKPKINNVGFVPIIDVPSNTVYGGNTLSVGSQELPKITMEGHIDTPCELQGSYNVPSFQLGGIRYTYADYIAMLLEGRASTLTPYGVWQAIQPLWFRDPYGRVYNNPTFFDFSASYVESIPGRTNFTMILMTPGAV